jgi:hypothetical protein
MNGTQVTLQPTPVNQIAGMHRECVDYFDSDSTKSLEFRRTQLRQLYKMVKENEDLLLATENTGSVLSQAALWAGVDNVV